MNDLHRKLKMLRTTRKLTQEQLSIAIGLSRATISNYEVGRRVPHLPELQLYADYFGVGLDYFGVASRNEVFDVLTRAKDLFDNPDVPKEEKEKLYKELLKLYLSME